MNALALKCCAVALIVVTVGCNVGCKCTCDGVKEKQTVTVRAEDISTKVQIIGRLGQPIGSLLRIRGKWIAQLSKGVPLHFEVSLINGKELHEKIEIDGGPGWADLLSPQRTRTQAWRVVGLEI